MKQQKLTGYQPKYPRKPLRGAAMTAAALVAIGGVTGCRAPIPQNPQTEGLVPMPEPTDQELVLDGEVAIVEPTEEELVPDGDVCTPRPTKNPKEQPLMTTGLPLTPTPGPSATPKI